MTTRKPTPPPVRPVQPDGPCGLQPGDLFTVTGEYGLFRHQYQWLPDGSSAAWGPVSADGRSTKSSRFRAFSEQRIKRIVNHAK